MTQTWQAEQKAFAARDLSGVDYVYVWADGTASTCAWSRRNCACWCGSGCAPTAAKSLIARDDGYREATESWADLPCGRKRCGMRAPVFAIGHGAVGFCEALREVFPETREQRCWFRKIANVPAALPKSAHPGRKKVLDDGDARVCHCVNVAREIVGQHIGRPHVGAGRPVIWRGSAGWTA